MNNARKSQFFFVASSQHCGGCIVTMEVCSDIIVKFAYRRDMNCNVGLLFFFPQIYREENILTERVT